MIEQPMLPFGPEPGPKWFNSPVTCHKGMLIDIPQYIPDFDRQEFALEQPHVNARLDMIVRKPFGGQGPIPIGIVSKDYVLVKHMEVIATATSVLRDHGIKPTDVRADLTISEYGERMALSVYLPKGYEFDPGDRHKLTMRLEIFNSVEGSTRFRALMGWFRFVCSNGLVIGVTLTKLNSRHVGDLNLNDVSEVLSLGLEVAKTEKENFRKWRRQPVSIQTIARWVEKDVKKQWGFKAATRAFHIARTGYDVEIIGQYKDRTPTTIETEKANQVPGCPTRTENLFDLSQILAWLAKERRDIQEQLEWREQIPVILEPLMNWKEAPPKKGLEEAKEEKPAPKFEEHLDTFLPEGKKGVMLEDGTYESPSMPFAQAKEFSKKATAVGYFYDGMETDKEGLRMVRFRAERRAEVEEEEGPAKGLEEVKAEKEIKVEEKKVEEILPEPEKSEAPKPFGSENKLVTKEEYEEIKKKIREKVGRLSMGVDPELVPLGIKASVFNIEAGARSFVDYARLWSMISRR